MSSLLVHICWKFDCKYFTVTDVPNTNIDQPPLVSYYCTRCNVCLDNATVHWLTHTVDQYHFTPLVSKCKYKNYIKKVDKVSKL